VGLRQAPVVTLLALLLSACGGGPPPDRYTARWSVRFDVEHPVYGHTPEARTVSGEIGLRPLRPGGEQRWMQVQQPTDVGWFDVDFRPFGFQVEHSSPDSDESTDVALEPRGADSVLIVLNPHTDHGGVRMWGHVFPDSISGSWDVPGTYSIASGRSACAAHCRSSE